jgi:hypothetical protein
MTGKLKSLPSQDNTNNLSSSHWHHSDGFDKIEIASRLMHAWGMPGGLRGNGDEFSLEASNSLIATAGGF